MRRSTRRLMRCSGRLRSSRGSGLRRRKRRNRVQLTENEWNEWKSHPATKALGEWLEAKREHLRTEWESGRFTAETCEATAMKSVNAIGKAEAYYEVQTLDFQTL